MPDSLLSKLKKTFTLPPSELPPEKEAELIEKIANIISKFGLETPAAILGAGLVGPSYVISQSLIHPMAPMLELFGIPGYDLAALFKKKENMRKLVERIEELEEARLAGERGE